MAATVSLALGAVGLFYLRFLEDSLRNSIFEAVEGISASASESIARFLDDSLRDAQAIAENLSKDHIEKKDGDGVVPYLKAMTAIYPKFENGVFLLDKDGILWADYPVYPETHGRSFAFHEYYQRTMAEKRGVVGIPYRSARTGQPVVTFTAPLRDRRGKIAGLIGCSVQLLASSALGGIRAGRIGKSGYLFVFDTSRLMILHPDEDRVLRRDVPQGANKLFDAATLGFEGAGETVDSRGVGMLLSLRRIRATNWILGAQQTRDEAFAPLTEARKRILLGMLLGAIAAALVGIVVIRRITEPLLGLRRAAARLGEPESERILSKIKARDEIGELAEAFKAISWSLRETMNSLKRASKEWERTFDSVAEAVFLLDGEQRILRLNRAAAQWLDIAFKDAVGRPCREVLNKALSMPEDLCETHPGRGETLRLEMSGLMPQGTYELTRTPIAEGDGRPMGSVLIVRDITARQEAEKAVRESEERYRDMVENSIDIIFTCDLQGRYTSCNRAMEELLGESRDRILGMNYKDFMSPETAEAVYRDFNRLYTTGESLRDFAYEVKTRNGRVLTLKGNVRLIVKDGRKVGFQVAMRDVTEQEKLEAHMQRSEKLEAIGTLAGGIAHDFNNILMAIMGHLNLARLYLDEDRAQAHRTLTEAEKAVTRATGLTRQLLTFSRGGEPLKELTSIRPLVEEAASMALGKATHATYEAVYDPELWHLEVDRGQIIQVLTNLFINARQAMPDGGLISIRAANRVVDGQHKVGNLPPGKYVAVSVKDRGIGIPAKNLRRIFDPFYTTKQSGSGLGLATSHSIITRHGGYIEALSTPGNGSTLTFYLPASTHLANEKGPEKERIARGSGRILIMDDEEAIREVAAQALRLAGYRVDAVEDGDKAVLHYKKALEERDPYRAVIFDLTIPGAMGGMEAMKILRGIDPQIRGIVSSGYSHDPIMAHPTAYGFSAAIQKPFKINQLTEVVEKILT